MARELLAMLDGIDAFTGLSRGAFTVLDGIDPVVRACGGRREGDQHRDQRNYRRHRVLLR